MADKPALALVGGSGNAFYLLGAAQEVAALNDMNWEAIEKEATSGDYDHLLQVLMKYFEVE